MEFSSSRLAGRCTVGGGGAVVGVGGVGVLGGWTFEAASDHFFGINPVARYRQKKKKTPPPHIVLHMVFKTHLLVINQSGVGGWGDNNTTHK